VEKDAIFQELIQMLCDDRYWLREKALSSLETVLPVISDEEIVRFAELFLKYVDRPEERKKERKKWHALIPARDVFSSFLVERGTTERALLLRQRLAAVK